MLDLGIYRLVDLVSMPSRNIYKALEVADFRWLWIGSLASSFAMNMQIVARGWLVYELTSSPMDLAWVTLAFMLPTVLFSLAGGVVADRTPKRLVIVVAQTLNCIATIFMGWIILKDQVVFWDFIWFGLFNGTILALSMPARQAFAPELIPQHLIFTGMALNTTSWNLSRILGPALAGFLIAWVAGGDTSSTYGVGIVYFVIAFLYFLSVLTTLLISKAGIVRNVAEQKSVIRDMRDAFSYVLDHPPVFGLILLSIVPFLFGMTINTMLPAFNQDILSGGADDLGILMSSMGIGAILGSLLLASASDFRNRSLWLVGTCVAWGVVTAAFGLATSFGVCIGLIALIGFVSSWNMSLNRGLLQLQVEDHMRGRILSVDMMSHGLMPLGVIPISIIAELFSISAALFVSGICFVICILLLWVFSGSVRRVDENVSVTT